MRVYKRGGRLRLRKRLGKIASMTLSLAMVSSAMAFALNAVPHAPNSKKKVHAAEHPSEPSHSPEGSNEAPHSQEPSVQPTTVASEPAPPPPPSEPSPEPSHSSEPSPQPSHSPDCHNSYDPACGDFSWDPAPGDNAAMTTTLTWSPQNPHPGDDVTFTFTADDSDASISTGDMYARYGDGPGPGAGPPQNCSGRYGPWTPPAKQHGHQEVVYHHTYTSAGDFHLSFLAISAGNACYEPYLSRGENNQTIHVTSSSPEPSPSPTQTHI